MMQYVVNVSSGLASIEALERTIDQKGKENTTGIFADVKGNNDHEHTGEDADNYRFLADVARYFDIEIVHVMDGRDIWQVFFDARAMTLPVGRGRVARCSIELKRAPIDGWIAARYAPSECVQVTGLGWTEPHRIASFEAAKAPYECWFPLAEPPYMDNCHLAAKWEARGIQPPKLYLDGFSHANCGGFCVKAGKAHFARLYATNKPRYLYHAEQEQAFRATINPNVAILRDQRNGETKPMTLYEFAERLERGESYDADDWGGCGCFAPIQQTRMDDLLLEAV